MYQKIRVPAFYAAITLYVLAFLALPSRGVLAELFTAWGAAGDIHAVHDLTGAAFLWVALLGVIVQLSRPDRRATALFGVVAGWIVLLAVLVAGASSLVILPLVFLVLSVPVAVFHPTARSRLQGRVGRGFTLAPLVLVVLAAIPVLPYAVTQASMQVSVADTHAADGHYALMTASTALLLVFGLVASKARTGWRFPAWSAGGMAIVLGLSSIVFPQHTSSVGATWGMLAVGWGVAFIAVSEGTALDTVPAMFRRTVGGTG